MEEEEKIAQEDVFEQENVDEQEEQFSPQENEESNPEEESSNEESNNAESNFKRLRDKNEQIRRERDEAINLLRQIEYHSRLAEQQQTQKIQPQEEEEIDIDNDDYTPRKYVDKRISHIENQLKGYQQKTQEQTIEARLKSQYSDFDDVVSQENIESLRRDYPEIAHSLAANKDLDTQARSVYTIIKKLGISRDRSYDNEKNQIIRNSNKPRSTASANAQHGSSPLSKANEFASGLTEDLKAKLYREMMEAKNN